MKNLTGCPILATFLPPKTTKIHNNKNLYIFQTSILTREVLKKSLLALPCCMGIIILFDPHAAWECENLLLRHLPSENAIFFTFAARPQREAQKSWKRHFGINVSASRCKLRKSKIALKPTDPMRVFENDHFLFLRKSHGSYQIIHIFPTNFKNSRKLYYTKNITFS